MYICIHTKEHYKNTPLRLRVWADSNTNPIYTPPLHLHICRCTYIYVYAYIQKSTTETCFCGRKLGQDSNSNPTQKIEYRSHRSHLSEYRSNTVHRIRGICRISCSVLQCVAVHVGSVEYRIRGICREYRCHLSIHGIYVYVYKYIYIYI